MSTRRWIILTMVALVGLAAWVSRQAAARQANIRTS